MPSPLFFFRGGVGGVLCMPTLLGFPSGLERGTIFPPPGFGVGGSLSTAAFVDILVAWLHAVV